MIRTIRINDKKIPYTVSRRKVKNARFEFKTCKLHIVLPLKLKDETKIIKKHKKWIYNNYIKIEAALKNSSGMKLCENRSLKEFRKLLAEKVSNLSCAMNVSINKILIRTMTTNWASMSSKKNMTVNSCVRMLPDEFVEYIVHHELTHLIEKKHNKKYWNIVSNKYGNYKKYEEGLFKYWFLIQNKVDMQENLEKDKNFI